MRFHTLPIPAFRPCESITYERDFGWMARVLGDAQTVMAAAVLRDLARLFALV